MWSGRRCGPRKAVPTKARKPKSTDRSGMGRRIWMAVGRGVIEALGLFGIGEGVGEVVGVFAVGDEDVHGAAEAGELAGGGIGNDDDVEVRGATIHGGVVLKDEGAGATLQGAGDTF